MQDNQYYFPYGMVPYYYAYPIMQNPYQVYPTIYDDLWRYDGEDEPVDYYDGKLDEREVEASSETNETNEDKEEFVEAFNESEEDFDESKSRTIQDVNRVVNQFERQHGNIYNELQRAGMDIRLIRFLVRNIVSYVDRNYNKYTGTLAQKTSAAMRDLRRDQPCIFSIIRVFGISAARTDEIVRTIVSFSFQNLRVPIPRE